MSESSKVAETGAAGKPAAARGETSLREYLESLLVTVILALFGTTFVVQAFKIPSPSMEPTLLVGDHLLVNKFIFEGRGHWYDHFLPYRDIRRGDVIVFHFPFDDHPHYVKRVIGIPGDRIKIVDQQVYVNDVLQKEPYAVHDPQAYYDPFGVSFPPTDSTNLDSLMRPEWAAQILNYVQNGELVVPPGKYFAMGDNRDHSWDSRYWGFVDREAIMGRPVVIYWSVSEPESESTDEGFGSQLIDLFDSLIHIFSRTRGARMFHEVH
jgi:signal peptidase I